MPLKTAAGFAIAVMIAAGPALAQSTPTNGTTSGPAADNNVQPSGAAQKKDSEDKSTGANAAGAPGVAAKKGSESGAAPEQKPDN